MRLLVIGFGLLNLRLVHQMRSSLIFVSNQTHWCLCFGTRLEHPVRVVIRPEPICEYYRNRICGVVSSCRRIGSSKAHLECLYFGKRKRKSYQEIHWWLVYSIRYSNSYNSAPVTSHALGNHVISGGYSVSFKPHQFHSKSLIVSSNEYLFSNHQWIVLFMQKCLCVVPQNHMTWLIRCVFDRPVSLPAVFFSLLFGLFDSNIQCDYSLFVPLRLFQADRFDWAIERLL